MKPSTQLDRSFISAFYRRWCLVGLLVALGALAPSVSTVLATVLGLGVWLYSLLPLPRARRLLGPALARLLHQRLHLRRVLIISLLVALVAPVVDQPEIRWVLGWVHLTVRRFDYTDKVLLFFALGLWTMLQLRRTWEFYAVQVGPDEAEAKVLAGLRMGARIDGFPIIDPRDPGPKRVDQLRQQVVGSP